VNHAPEVNEYECRARVGRLLTQSHERLVAALDKALAPHGVTVSQYVVVAALAAGPVESAAQLCKQLSASTSAMTRMLDRLEAKQLVSRARSTQNRRALDLALTPHGAAVYPALRHIVIETVTAHFDGLPMAALPQLEHLLTVAGGDQASTPHFFSHIFA